MKIFPLNFDLFVHHLRCVVSDHNDQIQYCYTRLQSVLSLVTLFVAVLGNNASAQTNSFPASGNVGIGISNPTGRLHIDGPLDGSLSTLKIGSSYLGNIRVPVGASTGGYNIDFHTWRDAIPEQVGARIRAERINNYQADNALVQSMDLTFSTSNGWEQSQLIERLRIKSNGDVGIGVSDPKGYKLAVGGSMIAESIKVKTLSTWPDYVFYQDYELPSLKEIKEFIRHNRHLPDLPSADDVDSNGIDVGEMNAKLLRKIEELTLYLIDQNERLDRQQKEIDILKNRK